MNGEVRMFL